MLKNHFLFFCLIALFGGVSGASTIDSSGGNCSNQWEEFSPFVHPTLLDTSVEYWRYRVELPAGKPIAFRIKGRFPFARYMSFNIYDQASLDLIQNSGIPSAITDVDIRPDKGSLNPYRPGVVRSVRNRSYSVTVLPPTAKPSLKDHNFLMLPNIAASGKSVAIELWYRIYLPDHYDFKMGNTGGVPLPVIEAYDPDTGAAVACPVKKTVEFDMGQAARKNLPPPSTEDGTMRFYHRTGSAMYPNGHTDYVGATMHFTALYKDWKVAVVRLLPPKYSKTWSGSATPFSGKEEVRYWSFCIGTPSIYTVGCLSDEQMVVGSDGYVNLVIGEPELEAEVKKAGLNFLSRKKLMFAFLLYRNLRAASSWKYNIANVPFWHGYEDEKEGQDLDSELEASVFLKEHAPQGRQCSLEDFRKDYCGVGVSFPASR